MPRKLLHKGVCWRAIGPVVASLPAVSRLSYWCCCGRGRIRIISWRRGSSAGFLASRTVAWDSSLSANASKVLSTRAALADRPAATLSCFDSQQFWRAHFIHLAIATPTRSEADAYAEFIDAASIATVSALLQSSLSARHSFFGKQNLPSC